MRAVSRFSRATQAGIKMKTLGLALALALARGLALATAPFAAIAGSDEDAFAVHDAFQVVEWFKESFDAADVGSLVKLFTPNATVGIPGKLATTAQEIARSLRVLRRRVRGSIAFEQYQTAMLSADVVLFTGLGTFVAKRHGKAVNSPARFNFLVT